MQPSMEVKCGVDNCQYWKSSYCHAKGLQVNAMGDGKAHSSDGTCCTTFAPRGQ